MVIERSPVRRNEFDSSDEEDETYENITPFHVDWVDLSFTGCGVEVIGISGLPGCKFRGTNRNLHADIADLKTMGITDVFVFCSQGEMVRCRVPYLIDEYHCAGFDVHHFPVEVGNVPTMNDCANVIAELLHCISVGGKAVLHCVSGLGISCVAVVAILLLSQDELMSPEYAISKLRQIRGQGAVHTVKEYNFVFEFRDLFKQHLENQQNPREVPPRSLSR